MAKVERKSQNSDFCLLPCIVPETAHQGWELPAFWNVSAVLPNIKDLKVKGFR